MPEASPGIVRVICGKLLSQESRVIHLPLYALSTRLLYEALLINLVEEWVMHHCGIREGFIFNEDFVFEALPGEALLSDE